MPSSGPLRPGLQIRGDQAFRVHTTITRACQGRSRVRRTGDARIDPEVFPICRSITGDGLRQTLSRLGDLIPLETHEVPTGTQVFDWTIPKEWNIQDAFIKDCNGRRVVDFKENNLHVVNYSVPVRARMTLRDLRAHLHSLPAHPDWIPYRTSYYQEAWGFCLSHWVLESLPDDEYEVVIDSSLGEGALTFAECVVPGRLTTSSSSSPMYAIRPWPTTIFPVS